MKERWPTLLKLLISLGLLVVLVQRVDLNQVWSELRGTELSLLLVAILLYLGAIASNALKWAILVRAQGVQVPFSSLLRHTFVAVFFNNFMPFVAADVIRGYALVRETASTADVTVSVVVDRLIGLLAFTAAGSVAALVAVRWPEMVLASALRPEELAPLQLIAQVGLLLTCGAGIGFLLLLSGRVRGILEKVVARVPRLQSVMPLFLKLSAAVSAYRRQPVALLAALLVGFTTILLSNIVNWLLFLAIGTHLGDPNMVSIERLALAVFVFNPIVGMTMALPISIAGLGVNQNIFPWLYGLVNIAETSAVAASLLLQLTIIVTSLPGLLIFLTSGRTRSPEVPLVQPGDR